MTIPALDRSVDLVANALNRLPAYAQQPKIQALVSSLVSPVQIARNTVIDIIEQLAIDNAVGVQLDRIGKIVGQAREALDDVSYRARLRVKIAVSKSKGSRKELIRIARLFVGLTAGGKIVFDNQGIASYALRVTGLVLNDADAAALAGFLSAATESGVRGILESGEYSPTSAWLQYDVTTYDTSYYIDARDDAHVEIA